jgi:hypothetical protein
MVLMDRQSRNRAALCWMTRLTADGTVGFVDTMKDPWCPVRMLTAWICAFCATRAVARGVAVRRRQTNADASRVRWRLHHAIGAQNAFEADFHC